ncbi:MAG TPA: hypothetical protein VGD83_27220, partial [Streptosporangiaceae bacterium]
FSPVVTHALVRVPLAQAADASGLLTTTIQLGQAVGVATFGSLFLTLDSAPGADSVRARTGGDVRLAGGGDGTRGGRGDPAGAHCGGSPRPGNLARREPRRCHMGLAPLE